MYVIHYPITKSTNKRSEVSCCEENNPPSSMVVDVVDKGSESIDDRENEYDGVQNVETTGSDEKTGWHVDLALHIKM